jgi:hypothetical protein
VAFGMTVSLFFIWENESAWRKPQGCFEMPLRDNVDWPESWGDLSGQNDNIKAFN